MNANELADELRKSIYEQIANINFHDVADFICQQQAEIEALKQQVAFLEDWRDTWSPTIKQLMNINVKVNDE